MRGFFHEVREFFSVLFGKSKARYIGFLRKEKNQTFLTKNLSVMTVLNYLDLNEEDLKGKYVVGEFKESARPELSEKYIELIERARRTKK